MLAYIEAKKLPYEVSISAIAEAYREGNGKDVILLSPQVRFNINKIKQMFPDKIVMAIAKEDFASDHVEKVLLTITEVVKKDTACKRSKKQ